MVSWRISFQFKCSLVMALVKPLSSDSGNLLMGEYLGDSKSQSHTARSGGTLCFVSDVVKRRELGVKHYIQCLAVVI